VARFPLLDYRETMPPVAVTQHLGLAMGQTVFCFRRWRTVNDAICACEQRYLPSDIAHRLAAF